MIDLRGENSKYVSSGYGKRKQPTAGASTDHKGLDIVLPDYNVPSVKDGEVTYVGYTKSGGNMVYITHADGVTARYLHLANPSNLSVGDVVREGDTIGIMGSTGYSTGDHLHIDFQRGGVTLDPNEYFNSGGSGAFVTTSNDNDSSFALGIVGKVIQFVVILLVLVLAVILFMKAFDINIK